MNKGLEALKYIKSCGLYAKRDERKSLQFVHIKDIRPEDLDAIEKELKRLEELEEEKQSFDRVIEKKLKALEIIKKKLPPLMRSALLDYCNKEEYELLKEVLNYE